MKLAPAALITAALASTATADSFKKQCVNRGCFGTWYSAFGEYRGVLYQADVCFNNPGPPGMQQLCLYTSKGYGYFQFENQDWRCLIIGSKTGDSYNGEEIWKEVSCETWS